jgi:hypothetical protein
MSHVQPEDRERVKSQIQRLIREVEVATKENPASEEQINKGVIMWEEKLFDKLGSSPNGYFERVTAKQESCERELAKVRNAAGAKVTVPAPVVEQVAAAPPAQTTAAAAPGQAHAPFTGSAPPRTNPTTVQQPTASNTGNQPSNRGRPSPITISGLKDIKKVDELRDPLEQCRSILRIINVFGMGKRDLQLKEEFMRIFQRTTDSIKSYKSGKTNTSEMEQQVTGVAKDLTELRERLEPRFKMIKDLLNAKSDNDVIELDALPFGLLERAIEVNGNAAYAQRCRAASIMLGGRGSLKRTKLHPDQ